MRTIPTAIATLVLTCVANGAEIKEPYTKKARVDVSSKAVKLISVKNTQHPSWIKDEDRKSKNLISHSGRLSDDSWSNYEFEFTPEADGKVTIALRGMWYKPKGAEKIVPVWVCFDQLEIEGAHLVNGSFEKLEEGGTPVRWRGGKSDMVITDQESAADGDNYVKVHHNKSFVQTINVKEGQMVKFKARVKAAK